MARKREESSSKENSNKDDIKNKNAAQPENSPECKIPNFGSFKTQLAAMGLMLREVSGDGNCLFRALGDQLEGHTANHLQHRFDTAQFMQQHREDFEPFVEDNVPFDTYINNLETPGTFAGNDAIVAFSRNHSVTIVIHQLNSPLWKVHGCDPGEANKDLHIAYHNGDHYSSIRRLGDYSCNPADVHIAVDFKVKQNFLKKKLLDSSKECDECEEDLGDPLFDPEEHFVELIMKETGCEDRGLVEETLAQENFNAAAAVECVMLISRQEETMEGYDGTATTEVFDEGCCGFVKDVEMCITDNLCCAAMNNGGEFHLTLQQRMDVKLLEHTASSDVQKHPKSEQSDSGSGKSSLPQMEQNKVELATKLGCLDI